MSKTVKVKIWKKFSINNKQYYSSTLKFMPAQFFIACLGDIKNTTEQIDISCMLICQDISDNFLKHVYFLQ